MKKSVLLYDEKWLKEQYLEKKLTLQQIAYLSGVKRPGTVRYALKKFNIGIRKENRKLQSHKYRLLNDYAWIYEKYITEKLSTISISNLLGIKSCNSVRQALQRHGIPIRNSRDAQITHREGDAFKLCNATLEGNLLGDGSLKKSNRTSQIAGTHFSQTNKYLNHILYVAEQFYENPEEWVTKDEEGYYTFRTLSYDILNPYFSKWYPADNDFEKVIPDDIEITPKLLLHWFLGDGSSYQRRKESKTKQVVITFCSECFSKNDQDKLCEKINKKYNLGFYTRKLGPPKKGRGYGYRIEVGQSHANQFYQLIGLPPFPEMAYKWK